MLRPASSLLLALALAFPACRETPFTAGKGTEGEAKSRPDDKDGGTRPTDDSEGVEGYLTDPAAVARKDSGGRLVVSGGPGAVVGTDGKPAPVRVGVWSAGEPEASGKADEVTVAARLLACGAAGDDGAFSLTTEAPDGDVALTAGLPCDGATLTAREGEAQVRVAVSRGGGKFVPLATLLPKSAADPEPGPGADLVTKLTFSPFAPRKLSDFTCPEGGEASMGFANCAETQCLGIQMMCTYKARAADADDAVAVVTELKLTPGGAHSSVVDCGDATGLGSIADCSGGSCNGMQTFCIRTSTYKALPKGARFVTAVGVTALGVRATTASCAAGQELAGQATDCGNGTCQGVQSVCVTYGTKP